MKQLLLAGVLIATTLPAQNVFWGNGIPTAYVENTPGVLGQQLTVGFGSPTAVLPLAMLALSDGLGPVFVPGPHFGNIGLDLFSPAFQILTFGLDLSGNGSATLLLPPGYPLATDPPLFMLASTFEATAFSRSKTVRIEWANPNAWEQVGSLGTARQMHTATTLGSGPRDNVTEVLICGGATGSIMIPAPHASAELYSPLTRTLSPLPPMSLPRAGHRAVRLHDGRALITGGVTTGGVVTATCEFFDITTLSFSVAPQMSAPRAGHAMTLLDDGRVLVSGGVADWQNAAVNFGGVLNTIQASAELYDPGTNSWSPLPNTHTRRFGHSQTKLLDGRVLVVSGITAGQGGPQGHVPVYARSCVVFDPVSLTFTATALLGDIGAPLASRGFHGASLLPNGDVLVCGGFVNAPVGTFTGGDAVPTSSCGIWNGAAWTPVTGLPTAVAFHTQVPDGNGALCIGGFVGDLTQLLTTAQVVHHDGATVTSRSSIGLDGATGSPQSRAAHSCTRLYDGTLLVYGGAVWPNTLVDGWVYTGN